MDQAEWVVFGESPVSVDDIVSLAEGRARPRVSDAREFRARLAKGPAVLDARLAAGERIYGVTTGFGESCLTEVPAAHVQDLSVNLVRFHGCGTGALLTETETASVMAARVASLVSGWSAIRPVVVDTLCTLLDRRILPCIPCEGSVGASGDLTPLSYVAAVVMGEREVRVNDAILPAEVALRQAGIGSVRLGPKESLAIMNGTSVMTGLACLAFHRAERLARLAATLTSVMSDVLRGNPAHFDARIHAARAHPGQVLVARWVREHLNYQPARGAFEGRIQDRYSIRCAPQVVGVLLDGLAWMRPWLEIELNGANDNPLIDPESGEALHGGNFYGGHACFVADALKNAVANVADLLDRQLALLCSKDTSNGLPENLVARSGAERAAHHGFKAMQIGASALTAEALKLTMPASVFSRSTECHNQDKVSMGTIAARDALRVVELAETVATICALAAAQAVDLRGEACHSRSIAFRDAVRTRVPMNDGDRRQDADIATILTLLRQEALPLAGVGDSALATTAASP